MNIVYLGAPITVNLSVGQTIAVNTNGTVTVECVSGLGLTDGATIGSIHGSATYGPFSAVGVARITATVRDGAYEVSDGQPIPIDTVLASSGQTVLDDASRAALNASGYGPLAAKISAAYQSARNNSPLDLAVMASPPTVTVGAAAITNGQAYNYFDTEGHKRIRIKDERIHAGPAGEDVGAIIAAQDVIASATRQNVITKASGQAIVAIPARECVIAIAALKRVVVSAAIQRVITGVAIEQIYAAAAKQTVHSIAAAQRVITNPAIEPVVATASDQAVAAFSARQRVIAIAAIQRVGAFLAQQRIVTSATGQAIGAFTTFKTIIAGIA